MKGTIYTIAVVCVLGMAGCAADEKSGVQQRQEEMLENPYGYKPEQKKYDISGGDLGNFDRDAFGKDMDSVLNP